MKVSTDEPAERPYTIALSQAEILVLVNHHIRTAKKIPTLLGKHLAARRAASTSAYSFRPNKSILNHIIESARTQIESHHSRAKGLLSILPK